MGLEVETSHVAVEEDRLIWFPDWRGETVVLVGAGPSLTEADVSFVRGRARVIVINRSHELAPWADVLYGCDGRFWRHYETARLFAGLKVTQDAGTSARWPEIRRVRVGSEKMSIEPGVLGSGGNGGFQALNLAIQFGARRIVLIGFDMDVSAGVHWHGKHEGGLNNPHEALCEGWREHFARAVSDLEALGVEVVNATRGGALEAFPRVGLQRVLS